MGSLVSLPTMEGRLKIPPLGSAPANALATVPLATDDRFMSRTAPGGASPRGVIMTPATKLPPAADRAVTGVIVRTEFHTEFLGIESVKVVEPEVRPRFPPCMRIVADTARDASSVGFAIAMAGGGVRWIRPPSTQPVEGLTFGQTRR